MSPRVRFEPLGEEIECASEETILDASFRHGYNLVYGCREGQCSACKCFLVEGEAALRPYSSFALSDTEQANGYSLMCRAMPESDLVVELLHYDPESYRLEHPIREGSATVELVEAVTSHISRLRVRVDEPADFSFVPGQYVDLHVPGAPGLRRSFSLANVPDPARPPTLELLIRRYPGGRISGMLGDTIKPGAQLGFTGPYGAFHVRRSSRPILMIAAGSGMAPILSMLRRLAVVGCDRPVRFFYGARGEEDLFAVDEIEALGGRMPDFRFIPVLSGRDGRHVQDAVDECLRAGEIRDPDAYLCGPVAMVEAAEELLIVGHKLDEQRIFTDKFTMSADAVGAVPPTGPGAPATPTAGAAPAGADEGRQFEWYRPHKRRATLYEDVTVDSQPSIHRHLTRGWPLHFEDGRGTWNEESTALRSSDWFEFRDPGEQWERPFYQRGAAAELEIEGAIRSAVEEDLIADFSPAWIEFLRAFLQGPGFVEHGIWLALATAARDCLSDSVATCVCLQAAMKQRSAQAIVLYAMDLEEHLGGFSVEAAKESFVRGAAWQPARRFVERLAATPDWGEVIVAANLCLEPILGTLIRRELGTRAAGPSGDTVTPVLARVAAQEWEWVRAWSSALCRFLLADQAHGAENRARISAWVTDWMPQAEQAALGLAPLLERVPLASDAIGGVRDYAGSVLEEAGLPELRAVVGLDPGVMPASGPAASAKPAPAAPAAHRRRRRTGPVPRALAASNGHAADGALAGPESGGTGGYDYVGIVMAKSAEGDAVASVLGRRAEVEVIDQPAFWEIRAKDRLLIPYDQVSDELGYPIDAYSIQHEMSTHYGRLVAADDALMLFSDPTEAIRYLMS